jgi:hypothetical protein
MTPTAQRSLERPNGSQSTTESNLRHAPLPVDSSPTLRFLKTYAIKHVSRFCVLDMDKALEASGFVPIIDRQGKIEILGAKVLSRLQATRNFRRSSAGPVFVACMRHSESRILPFAYWTEIIPYCFDCWEPEYDGWHSFFLRHRIRLAFFSARQSAQYFADLMPGMTCSWVPEATDPAYYDPQRKLVERDIDVLELGRKHDGFHPKIVKYLIARRRTHLFEKVKGEVLYGDRRSLADGLGRSKISVCFPCSQTHVERAGSVETVTHRYFESIASKCILLGHCPSELAELFGYNPVIEVELGREVEQIESILSSLDSFQNLVERNYARLLQVGTWQNRIPVITKAISQLSGRPFPEPPLV